MSLHLDNPFKENVCIVGMGQEGKTNLLADMMWHDPNPYTIFDTMGVFSRKNFQPLRPKTQRIVKPHFAQKTPSFLKTCKEIWGQGNCIFAIEEMSAFCTKHYMPPELESIINQGGNKNISYRFTTRRVAQIHNDIIANCQHHFIFRTYLPQDVEWYEKVVPKEIIMQSKDLPKYHFIYYPLGGQARLYQPVKRVL